MEDILKEVEAGLQSGTLSKEDAKLILEDVQRTLEIEETTDDLVLKGHMLKTVATLLKLV